MERLRRTVRRLAEEGIIEARLLDRARPQHSDDRLVRLVAGIKAARDRTLQQIAAQLETMRERTPRGGTRWHPSSVKHLLARAERLVLAGIKSVKVGLGIQPRDHDTQITLADKMAFALQPLRWIPVSYQPTDELTLP